MVLERAVEEREALDVEHVHLRGFSRDRKSNQIDTPQRETNKKAHKQTHASASASAKAPKRKRTHAQTHARTHGSQNTVRGGRQCLVDEEHAGHKIGLSCAVQQTNMTRVQQTNMTLVQHIAWQRAATCAAHSGVGSAAVCLRLVRPIPQGGAAATCHSRARADAAATWHRFLRGDVRSDGGEAAPPGLSTPYPPRATRRRAGRSAL